MPVNECATKSSEVERGKDESEVSDKIQNASYRIYNAMRKNVVECPNESENDTNVNEMLKDVHETGSASTETSPLKKVKDESNYINVTSIDTGVNMQPTFKAPRPPTPSQLPNGEALMWPPKNVISKIDLNEGAVAASKLHNFRLLNKGLSKSVAGNLNGELHPTSQEECSSPDHSPENLLGRGIAEKNPTDHSSGTCVSA